MRSVAILFAVLAEDVSATGRKLNAGQRLGVHDRSKDEPPFPELMETDFSEEGLDWQGTTVENKLVDSINQADLMNILTRVTTLGVHDSNGNTVPGRSWQNPQATDITEQWLQTQFRDMGFDSSKICVQKFTEQGVELANVVAFVDAPDSAGSVTVGAHYDSRPFTGLAPGANDNGSGLSALIAMAKAFKGSFGHSWSPRKPVYFVAFAGEEAGLYGSKHFVKALTDASDTSLPASCRSAMLPKGSNFLERARSDVHLDKHEALILDEIGWSSPSLDTETVNLETYDTNIIQSVLGHLLHSNKDHNGKHPLRVIHSNHPFGSDHMSWLNSGRDQMPAVLSINGDDEAYPNYHKSTDKFDSVSGDMLTKVTKMNAGALVRMVGVRKAQTSLIAKHM